MKLLIWGTGRLTGKVVGKHIPIEQIQAFIDNSGKEITYMGKPVLKPEEVCGMEYDAVLVANMFSREIREQCLELDIPLDRVIFLYHNCIMQDINEDYGFIEKIVGKEYTDIIKNRYHIVRGVEAYGQLCLSDATFSQKGYMESDYVRMKSFELAVKEIRKRNVAGAVAEVGVFKGEFAQYLNFAFPERKCYLFDTFDGFDVREALNEVKQGNCTDAFVEAYKHTNIGEVLEKMKYLDQVIIKQGIFPNSLEGMEDRFAFVSLDVDFEDSIYEGLNYFYPRLSEGGYLFIHDYNSCLQGVEKAVDRYESEYGNLCKMPLPDANGTLIITR